MKLLNPLYLYFFFSKKVRSNNNHNTNNKTSRKVDAMVYILYALFISLCRFQ